MKRLGQKICVAVVLSLAFVAIWHDSAKAAMPTISSIGQIKGSSVVSPTRIDVDASGTIYLSDAGVNGVTRYNKYGQALPTLKGAYAVKSTGVAVTPDGSRVFVSAGVANDPNPTAVAVLDGATGALLGYLGVGIGEFQQTNEIDLDGSGNIYVGDAQAKIINVYNGSTYAKIGTFGGPATNLSYGLYLPLNGEFAEIAGLTVDVASQEVLVAEGWGNNGIARVQVFGLDGTFKRLLPETTIAGTQVNSKPIGLSVDPSGRVYMLSSVSSTVHVFTTHPEAYLGKFTNGTPNPAIDASGKVIPWGVGMIPSPSLDTLFDPATGRLFVVTDGNGIQIFSVDGSTNPVKVNSAPATPAMLNPVQESDVATLTPTLQWAAALDADADTLNYNVRIVDANGVVVGNEITNGLSVTTGTLTENSKYGWQVQAADGESTSSYSLIENFWVNAVEEAPTASLLLSPEVAVTADKDTVFSWQAAVDADPKDVVTYRLEIAAGTDFTKPLISVEQSELSSAVLSSLPGYTSLQSGTTYQWRVVAFDATDLNTASEVRSFVYSSSMLAIDATFPGAKVYIGGNSAYSGNFVGEVPVELRDITPGTFEIVVERPGFEPWIKSVVVNAGQSISLQAALVVAISPGLFQSAPLTAGGVKIQLGAAAAPVLVDFDDDGLTDLLVADGSGKLFLYKGIPAVRWAVAAGVQLAGVTLPAGAVPFIADWNNDNRKDLLVGSADGTVSLYLNVGKQELPTFAAAVQLQADNSPLSVTNNAAPLLFDLNGDGKKDLLVGSGDGSVYKFLNIGTDDAPVFSACEVLISAESGTANAAPVVTDWNADGSKEILLANNQGFSVYARQVDGSYLKGGTVTAQQLINNKLTSLGENVRLVVADTDGIRGKDLLFGNATGQILLAASKVVKVNAMSPLFGVALLETVAKVDELIQAYGVATAAVTSQLNQLKMNISLQSTWTTNNLAYYDKAKANTLNLQRYLVNADASILAMLTKLQVQLNSKIPLN